MSELTFQEKDWHLYALYHIGPLENSIYFIFDHKSREAAIVDPAWEGERFVRIVEDAGYRITNIWVTHWHPDHTNAVEEIALSTGARIVAGARECDYLDFSHSINPVCEGDVISVGNTSARVLETPGHSRGSVCYLVDNRLIAGDTIFIFGAGHCSLPGSDATALYKTMQKIKTLPDNVVVHPGHDYGNVPYSSIGEQKIGNPFLMINNEHDFVRYRNKIHGKTRVFPMQKMSRKALALVLASNV